ncbi:hypothetical protein ACGFSB_32905 [Streptomyces sp. NPDC048441]|uniref:hypothetical protein n=1 Tax=Streptomyces sp. NPDC048441 TaxID=3365552 RepID=UPI003720C3B1
MALIKGMLLSYSDPLLGLVPVIVSFQYNPVNVTRVLTGPSGASASAAAQPARETYALKLELDATDGLETEGAITMAFGIGPRLAAIEMLMQPVGGQVLPRIPGASKGTAIPAGRLPLTLFVWGPGRITPVTLKSLTIQETAFDSALNPVHATADLGLTVLLRAELPENDRLARLAADFYQGLREVKAVLQLPQMSELGG